MPFRDRVRRALNRPIVRRTNRNGVKLEYFHRNEVPRPKFRGPFDPEHQRQLAEWSFQAAMAPRPRSLDLSLSPCTSLPDHLRPPGGDQTSNPQEQEEGEDEDIAPDHVVEQPALPPDVMDCKFLLKLPCIVNASDGLAAPTVTQIEDTHGRQADGGSQSSTMVDPDSFNGSVMTLLPESHPSFNKKESVRYTSPALRSASPPPKAKGTTYMPFSPEDLSRALNAVQIY